MRPHVGRKALAGLAALALSVSVVGPCRCLLSVAACHREAREADPHACCEKPAGVRAVADECCDSSPVPVAATDVREVSPPTLLTSVLAPRRHDQQLVPVASVAARPPLPLDRNTVLLI